LLLNCHIPSNSLELSLTAFKETSFVLLSVIVSLPLWVWYPLAETLQATVVPDGTVILLSDWVYPPEAVRVTVALDGVGLIVNV
jgi:hypothetical protein